jgi:hypothetical protein
MLKYMVFNDENHLHGNEDKYTTLCGVTTTAFSGAYNPSLRDCPECLAQRIAELEAICQGWFEWGNAWIDDYLPPEKRKEFAALWDDTRAALGEEVQGE